MAFAGIVIFRILFCYLEATVLFFFFPYFPYEYFFACESAVETYEVKYNFFFYRYYYMVHNYSDI